MTGVEWLCHVGGAELDNLYGCEWFAVSLYEEGTYNTLLSRPHVFRVSQTIESVLTYNVVSGQLKVTYILN